MQQDIQRLKDIQEEMLGLLAEADQLLRGTPAYQRAKSYWLAHVETALTNSHGYLGGSMCSMEDTITELEPVEACPGCGCLPGDGITSGCTDRDGCGWARSVHDGE